MYKFEKLSVWQKSTEFIQKIYSLCLKLPKTEEKILIDQVKRAATSVALNIAEGSAAENDIEFKRYLTISKKSLFECVAVLKIIEKLYNIPVEEELLFSDEIGKMLSSLVKYLNIQSKD